MPQKSHLLPILIALTGLAIFAQLALLFVNYLMTYEANIIMSSMTWQLFHAKKTLFPFAWFIIAQTLVYSVYILMIWYSTISLESLFSLRPYTTYYLGIFLWCVCTLAVMAANCYDAPYSIFSVMIRETLFNGALTDSWLRFVLGLLLSIMAIVMILMVINFIRALSLKQNQVRHYSVLCLLLGLVYLIMPPLSLWVAPKENIATAETPNIIIIGVDALRPDYIGWNNPAHTTPHLDEFLKQAVNFSDAYSPLARTFPAWTSILTATYPIHHGARGNMADLDEVQRDHTLAKRLQQLGYETIYATDDNRFNNVNESYGFDRVIGVPMGINDFLIGSINDFPLSNLIITTPLGKILFPYSYANRSEAATYDPNNFQTLLKTELGKQHSKPLFLAVHFCTSGWPFYAWDQKKNPAFTDALLYQNSVTLADQQLGQFFSALKKNHLLDHAIVVLLSDHGITLGLPGDRIIQASTYQGDKKNLKKMKQFQYSGQNRYGIDTSFGYGSDILSIKQNHAVLAFRGYGINLGQPHTVKGNSSLLDVAPTLMALLNKPINFKSDGISLKQYIIDQKLSIPNNRPLYSETSFSVPEIERSGISARDVLARVIKLYQINPETGLVSIIQSAEKTMIEEKQYAIMQGDWLLSIYPSSKRPEFVYAANGKPVQQTQGQTKPQSLKLQYKQMPAYVVLVNTKTKQWTTEWKSELAKRTLMHEMLNNLNAFYHHDGLLLVAPTES